MRVEEATARKINQQSDFTKNLPKHFENTILSRKFRNIQVLRSLLEKVKKWQI
jgi:hypothetical protein